jgi:hypothetical protein
MKTSLKINIFLLLFMASGVVFTPSPCGVYTLYEEGSGIRNKVTEV